MDQQHGQHPNSQHYHHLLLPTQASSVWRQPCCVLRCCCQGGVTAGWVCMGIEAPWTDMLSYMLQNAHWSKVRLHAEQQLWEALCLVHLHEDFCVLDELFREIIQVGPTGGNTSAVKSKGSWNCLSPHSSPCPPPPQPPTCCPNKLKSLVPKGDIPQRALVPEGTASLFLPVKILLNIRESNKNHFTSFHLFWFRFKEHCPNILIFPIVVDRRDIVQEGNDFEELNKVYQI